MRNLKFLLLISIIGYSSLGFSQSTLQFLSEKEASERLSTVDDFVSRLSSFDMSARMKTDQLVSKEDFLAFVGNSALDWNNSEISIFTQAFKSISYQLEKLNVELPNKIDVILTDGKEEGNAAYTRGNAIIVQRDKLLDEKELESMIAHEIFHIYTRNNIFHKDVLYKVIGFHSIPEIDFPHALKDRKITNPDAPVNNYAIKVSVNNYKIWVTPILFSSTPKYIPNRGGEFFDYLLFKLLVLKDDKGTILYDPDNPRIMDISEVKGYFEQVGKNTNYIIHPEEILADNFALLVLGTSNVPSPEIIDKIRRALSQSILNKSMHQTAKASTD